MASRSVGPMCSSLVAATLSKPQLNSAQEGIGNNLAEREVKKAKLHGSRWELVAPYLFGKEEPRILSAGKESLLWCLLSLGGFLQCLLFFCEMH